MLFHDRRTGTMVNIGVSDLLPHDTAVSMYTKHFGEHGEKEIPEYEGPEVKGVSDEERMLGDYRLPSKSYPELKVYQHKGIAKIHEQLKDRAARISKHFE